MDINKLNDACNLFEKFAAKKKPAKSKGKSKAWKKKPKGWTEKSVKQFSKSMMKGKKHPFTACVKKMKGKVKTPEAFCATVKKKFKGKK